MKLLSVLCFSLACLLAATASADETCNSPYMANLIKGQEDYIHVWTLGMAGMGDGSDKLVTIAVNPASPQYGKVVSTVSVGGRGDAHHMGFTDDRKYLWAGRLQDSKIFVFDVGSDPAHPRLVRTLDGKGGYVGPHTFYALPGRMLVGYLSNAHDLGGATGMVVYNNKGDKVASYAMPTGKIDQVQGDGYGYDLAINPARNAMVSTSFTGFRNYRTDLDKLIADAAAMRNFGNTMVLWDLKAMQPRQIFSTPGAPLEVRWSLAAGDDWAITATALTSKLWLLKPDAQGRWQARDVGAIGDPAKTPLPVDMSIAADGKHLWVNTFMDGKTRLFDVSKPDEPRQVYEKVTGKHVNMISQSWDGKRVYITTSLLEHWDLGNDDHFLKLYQWDGRELREQWKIDFYREKLGRPHHMKFSANAPANVADLR